MAKFHISYFKSHPFSKERLPTAGYYYISPLDSSVLYGKRKCSRDTLMFESITSNLDLHNCHVKTQAIGNK